MRFRVGWYTILGSGLLLVMSLLGPSLAEAAADCSLWDNTSNVRVRCPGGVFPTTCAAGQSLEGFDPADGVKKLCVGGTEGGTFLPVVRMHQAATACDNAITQAVVSELCVSLDTGQIFTCADPDATGSVTTCDAPEEWIAVGGGGTVTDQQAFDNGTGRVGPLAITKPLTGFGDTLEERAYEQGGNWIRKVVNSATGLEVSQATNILAGLTKEFLGNGVPIFALDGTTARATFQGVVNYCTSAVGTDLYACTLAPPLTAYTTGACYVFKADVANTTAASLNLNSLGAKTIKKAVGGVTTDLATNDIRAGQVVEVCYDGTNLQMQSTLGNAASGSGDVVGDDTTTTVQNIVAYSTTGGKNLTELTGTQGDILYHNGTIWAKLGPGTSGQVLQTNGAGANPSWAAAAGGGGSTAPIHPSSAIPVTAGMVYSCPIDGDQLLCVATATLLTSDAIWRLTYQFPPTLPTGCTYTLVVDMKANATANTAKINPKWAAWAVGAARPTSLTAETVTADSVTGSAGATATVTWGAGDTHQLIRAKWALNGTTLPVAGGKLAMDLTAEDSGYTLAVELGMDPYITCE